MSNGAVILSDHFNGDAGGIGLNNTLAPSTTITTSNSWWTAIALNSGTIASATASIRSNQSCRFDTNTGGSVTTADRTITSSSYVVLGSYFRWNSGSTGPTSNFTVVSAIGGGTNRAQIQITTGGLLRIRNNVTQVAISGTALTTNDWYRLEWELNYTGTTQTLRIFVGNDIHNDPAGYTEQLSGTFNTAAIDTFRCGFVSNPGNTAGMNMDEPMISYAGYVGPSFGGFNGAGVASNEENVNTL